MDMEMMGRESMIQSKEKLVISAGKEGDMFVLIILCFTLTDFHQPGCRYYWEPSNFSKFLLFDVLISCLFVTPAHIALVDGPTSHHLG